MSEQKAGSIPQWHIGDRLRKALEHADMNVGDMADYLEVDRNTVGNYLGRRSKIPGPALKLWAMRTGVPIEWLRTGSPPFGPGPGIEQTPEGGEPATIGILTAE